MHELGVVFYVIDHVKKVAEENQVQHVDSVTVEIGEVTGVIHDQLTDCWNWAANREELLKGTELVIETIHAITHCNGCNRDYDTVQHGRTCPHCSSGETFLVTGNEFIVKEISVSDEAPSDDIFQS